MKITTVNFKAELNVEDNFARIKKILSKNKGSNLVVFPEASLQGYMSFAEERSIKYYLKNALNLRKNNKIVNELQRIANTNHQVIVLGVIERDDADGAGAMYDSAIIFLPDKTLRVYRKAHLATNEPYCFFPGNSLEIHDTPVGKIGVLICYDKCFCEAAKTLSLKGAEIIIVISAWAYSAVDLKEKKNDHSKIVFDAYDQVRAVENQCLVVVANQVGVNADKSLEFLGSSKIVLPSGKIIGQLEDTPGTLTENIDLTQALIDERVLNLSALNINKQRRPSLYFN